MLKALGMLLIILSGTGMGFCRSMELTKREKNLEMLLEMAVLLKGEIRCGNASLHEAFLNVSAKMPGMYGDFLEEVSSQIQKRRGVKFDSIFRECVLKKLPCLVLEKQEWELFFSLGEHLGYLDLDMQMKQLLIFEEEVRRCMENLRKEMPEKKKVYQSLGVLGGMLLAVLVW